jgi:hypothetical protein
LNGVCLCALVVVAVGLRAFHLGSPMLWIDEAESALNALTIVATGLPGNQFLGQPLYENTLVRPWPESAEFEFRDISYSDRGLATYHGWLPLYAIAGAFRLAGVTPEIARHGTPLQSASPDDIARWTAVPRLPALLFSALFVISVWGLGRRVHSASAGWALGLAAATSNLLVGFGRQARYYSATLAGNAACALAIWNACRRGRVTDHAMVGLAIGTLFHIHSLSAATMVGLYAFELILARNQPRLWLRVLVSGGLAGVLVLPWAVWSGMLSQTQFIPAARHYLTWQMVFWSLPSRNLAVVTIAAVTLGWVMACAVFGARIDARWRVPFVSQASSFRFAFVWLMLSYVMFVGGMPAASYFVTRLKLVTAVPGLLVCALGLSAACRAARPQWTLLPVVAMAGFLVISGQVPPRINASTDDDRNLTNLVDLVRSWTLSPSTHLFSSPNDHLTLTYYTGRPVQSIAPVRKAWLDDPTHEVVIVAGERFGPLDAANVQDVARGLGFRLSRDEAHRRADESRRIATELDLRASGADVMFSRSRPLDDLDRALVETVRSENRRAQTVELRGTPLGRQFAVANTDEFRHAFFYWFSGPEWRTGPGLNYAACRARARVTVHPSGWTVFDCRRTDQPVLVPAVAQPPR